MASHRERRVWGSPRTRRRAAWSVGLLLVAAGAAVVVARLPGAKVAPEHFSTLPAQAVKTPRPGRLRAADRREIAATIERFVRAAVNRRAPAAAYDLATPSLRAGQTRAQWARGDLPVFPFRSRPTRFDDWRLNYVFANEVGLDVVLPPARGSKLGPIAFGVDLKLVRGRWLIEGFVPVAVFAPLEEKPGLTAHPDFAPAESQPRPYGRSGRLGAEWLALRLGMLGVLLLVPFLLLARAKVRERAAYRARAGAWTNPFRAADPSP